MRKSKPPRNFFRWQSQSWGWTGKEDVCLQGPKVALRTAGMGLQLAQPNSLTVWRDTYRFQHLKDQAMAIFLGPEFTACFISSGHSNRVCHLGHFDLFPPEIRLNWLTSVSLLPPAPQGLGFYQKKVHILSFQVKWGEIEILWTSQWHFMNEEIVIFKRTGV